MQAYARGDAYIVLRGVIHQGRRTIWIDLSESWDIARGSGQIVLSIVAAR